MHSGPCVVCFQGTDTAVAVSGDGTWHAAALMALGVPTTEAMAMIQVDDRRRGERWVTTVRVCDQCARSHVAGLRPALTLPGRALPGLVQP